MNGKDLELRRIRTYVSSPVREQINCLLDDGRRYADIVARLGSAGKGLNKENLSRWRKADHQDWLAQPS